MSVLLYDPDCGFCTASANLLRRLEPRARILPGTLENLVQYRVDARRFAHALPFINDAGQIIYRSDGIAPPRGFEDVRRYTEKTRMK